MTARCDLSDLPIDQCACRIHGPKASPAELSTEVVARSVAKFPGRCSVCDEPTLPGETIALVAAVWVHEECAA